MGTCAVDANQYFLVIFICISTAAFLAVLGIDLDFLVNGPTHIVSIISNVVNSINEEEIVQEEQLNAHSANCYSCHSYTYNCGKLDRYCRSYWISAQNSYCIFNFCAPTFHSVCWASNIHFCSGGRFYNGRTCSQQDIGVSR